jgi:hypothetical protein
VISTSDGFSDFMVEVINTILLTFPGSDVDYSVSGNIAFLNIVGIKYVEIQDHINWAVLRTFELSSHDLEQLEPLRSIFRIRPIIEYKSLLIEPLDSSPSEEAIIFHTGYVQDMFN